MKGILSAVLLFVVVLCSCAQAPKMMLGANAQYFHRSETFVNINQMNIKSMFSALLGLRKDSSTQSGHEQDSGADDGKLLLYTEQEYNKVECYIEETWGEIAGVYHEKQSDGIHVDVALIEPTSDRDYWTLVTIGVGALKMPVPQEVLKNTYQTPYMELLIHLPKEWDFTDITEENTYWPIRLLKRCARYPLYENTYIGDGHSIGQDEPYTTSVKFSNVLLEYAFADEENLARVRLGDDKTVVFYQLCPIHDDELQYKIEHGCDALLEQFEKQGYFYPHVVNPKRKSLL